MIDWSAGIGSSTASHICQLECGLVLIHTTYMWIHITHYVDTYFEDAYSGDTQYTLFGFIPLMSQSAKVWTCMTSTVQWKHTM